MIHFLVRHAESVANEKGNDEVAAVMAQRDIPLTTKGIAQAEELGQRLNQYCLEHSIPQLIVRYSPFVRTTQTWKAMAPFLKDVTILAADADERIEEIAFLPRGQIGRESFFPEHPRYLANETIAQIDDRLRHYAADLRELETLYPDAATLTVSHSTPKRILAAILQGVEDIQNMDIVARPGNASLWKVAGRILSVVLEGVWPSAAKEAPKPNPERVKAVSAKLGG